MGISIAGPRLPNRTDFAASLALSEALGPANARLIDCAYSRARDYEEDANTALLAVIRSGDGMKLWEEARDERLAASEKIPS